MEVKSDKWIRKMVNEHGMIEPFSEKQFLLMDSGAHSGGRRPIPWNDRLCPGSTVHAPNRPFMPVSAVYP